MSIQHDNIKIITKPSQLDKNNNKINTNPSNTNTNTLNNQTTNTNTNTNTYTKYKKIPFNIDVNIQHISDLISITEKYQFDSKYYYNINLKSQEKDNYYFDYALSTNCHTVSLRFLTEEQLIIKNETK